MKSLKLDHELAELVRKGEKTSTWRIFDDKDIKLDDKIALIDKVNPSDPTTWRVSSTIRVISVVEKPLSSITEDDFEGHEKFESPEVMLKTYQKYYGSRVKIDTSVKIIQFTLINKHGVAVR